NESFPTGALMTTVHCHFRRVRTGNQVGGANQIEEVFTGNPLALLYDFVLHHRDVRCRSAEGNAPEPEEDEGDFFEMGRNVDHGLLCQNTMIRENELCSATGFWQLATGLSMVQPQRRRLCFLRGYFIRAERRNGVRGVGVRRMIMIGFEDS